MLPEQFAARISVVASDRESGASELLSEVLSLLSDALIAGVPVRPLAEALLRAQPSMAPIWNATRAALACRGDVAAFRQYVEGIQRGSRALRRHAVDLLATVEQKGPLRIVTLSFSATVLEVFQALTARQDLEIACAEGQPAREGRRLAQRLADSAVPVTFFTDAAIGHALATADAVVLGADAITPDWFMNKVGSRMLVAAAAQQGVGVYIAAARNKFVSRAIAERLQIRDGAPSEVWPSPPAGVTVRNPYFESVPFDLVTAVISDVGVLGAALVPDACPTDGDDALIAR